MTRKVQRPVGPEQVLVTVLFADICGSTRLFEQEGDVRARRIEAQTLGVLAGVVSVCGGTVVKTIGDEIMGSFADAELAVHAACEMHQALKANLELAQLNIAIRIGLHHGPVLIEKGDVFGDAVNVAARMATLARADQVITTDETVRQLPLTVQGTVRRLGPLRVRGKREDMEVYEIIWRDSDSLTQMPRSGQEELRRLLFARLVLEYRGNRVELVPSKQVFSLGRGERNSLVVDRELVSRSHADIEFRQGQFILADHSTNGTYLLLEGGARFFVRREELTLHDRGIICLGQAVTNDDADLIYYQCDYPA